MENKDKVTALILCALIAGAGCCIAEIADSTISPTNRSQQILEEISQKESSKSPVNKPEYIKPEEAFRAIAMYGVPTRPSDSEILPPQIQEKYGMPVKKGDKKYIKKEELEKYDKLPILRYAPPMMMDESK